MFDEKELRKIHCVTTVEKLLWNINENLKALRAELPAAGGEPQGDGLRHCKHCDYACDTQTELMRHVQKEHPKPKDDTKG